jgi:ketosteroid isomerase-like protein
MPTLSDALPLLGLAACLLALSGAARGREDEERTIRAQDEAWSRALEAKDLDGVMASYADDAVLLPPNAPLVSGKAAIRERFAGRLAAPGYQASFVTTRVVVARARDVAWELGVFRVVTKDEAGRPVLRVGKHLVAWEKRGSHWKVTAESLNFDAP